jgi:CheY-like chemotaxis protein
MYKPFVLIVEDDPQLSDIFSTVLQHSGVDTEVVQDGGLALGRIAAKLPDVVLLDVHLPNVSGTSILNQMRADPKLSHIKVILTTADALIGQALVNKADIVLIKPVDLMQVLNITSRLLSSV